MAPKKLAALPSAKEMQDLSVKELKELCQKRDIEQGGKKDDLIKRLVSYSKTSDKGKENTAAAKNDKKETATKAQKAKADNSAADKPAKKGAAAKPDDKTADDTVAKAAAAKPDKKSSGKTTASDKKEEALTAQSPGSSTTAAVPSPKASPARASKSPAKPPAASPVKSPAKPAGPVIPEGPFRIVDHIKSGSTVILHNLSQADLNGKEAQVVEWVADKGRWKCKLLQKNFVANFRSWNLMLPIAPGAIVELRGLKSQPELNGKQASINEWIKQKGRWRCTILETEEPGDFLPNNMQLTRFPKHQREEGQRVDLVGQCVMLTGLRANAELNGQEAEVIAWVEEKERWDCNLKKDGRNCTFRSDNLALWNYASEPIPYEEVAQVFNKSWDDLKRLQESISASSLGDATEKEPEAKRPRVA